jgi:hypothetical protein
MVDVSIGLSDQSRLPGTVNVPRPPVRPDVVVAQRKTFMYFNYLGHRVNEKIWTAKQQAREGDCLKPAKNSTVALPPHNGP